MAAMQPLPLDTGNFEKMRMAKVSTNRGYWSRYYKVKSPSWPMAVHSLGFNHIPPQARNPMLKHPWHHWMDAEKGRVLQTLTLVHVIRGQGLFRSEVSGELEIPAGSLVFAFPNVPHSYFCKKESGWDDEWVEVEADGLLPMLKKAGILPENPIMKVGEVPLLCGQFRRLFDLGRANADEGRLAVCAYETIVTALEELKRSDRPSLAVERMRRCLDGVVAEKPPAISAVTRETGLSASWMRTVFRQETGLSPKRYQLTQRLNRAADLLRSTHSSISEIACLVGFCSLAAFSNSFAREFGCSPSAFRQR